MNVTYVKSLTKIEDIPVSHKPQVAFVGRSNVGKSTLINHLAHQKNLARVSSEPGRTQTINLFDVDKKLVLVDLPGYGYAKTSKEKREAFSEMLNDYLALSKQLKLVFLIIDARIGPTDLDRNMLDDLAHSDLEIVMILNKVDKLNQSELAKLKSTLACEYPGMELIPHSSVTNKGRNEILQAMKKIE
ncbi:MAG: ribosome biogenesis GTP-binding protein YihA/YsxC [Candidatus Uhrbacteria bacterium]|nr:ribosome biogenesis GTP-binding protein YihA/YsxC [Candidatus Uhrbacteria bacterium]